MNIATNKNGFEIFSKNTLFSFKSEICPVLENDLFSFEICGNVPIPEINVGDRLLLPIDEGTAISVEKEYESGEFDTDCIQGSFCSRSGTMSMVIIERKKEYLLINLENGINSEYKAERRNGMYGLEIICRKPCRVTYGLFNSLAEACKSYRNSKKETFLTLKEKSGKNPELNKLIGGAIFWIWNDNYDKVMYSQNDVDVSPTVGDALLDIAGELKRGGVGNAMFGLFFDDDSYLSEDLHKKYGYLSTQYDNYNDVFNPALLKLVPNNRIKNCGYTHRRMKDYPDGVNVNENGELSPAWALKGFDGKMYEQNTCCPLVASKRMKEEISQILKQYPYYNGRFIDVYGGGLSECHSPVHPLSRESCLDVKREAFEALEDMGLIVGTEDGFEDIINVLSYTEGLHSPVYFRIHDSGRNHAHNYNEEQALHIEKHMTDPECRVPLWHLVYHDCLLAFPYWGDSTEASHRLLRLKTLFACLYGCPPLYSFMVKDFEDLKDDILDSFKTISEIHKKVALLPMTDFKILSDDYMLQRSVFGDKIEITVNFSDTERTCGAETIKPYSVTEKEI